MSDFNPPIETRPTNELIAIAYRYHENWEDEAVQQAEKELTRRGITEAQELSVLQKCDNNAREIEIAAEKGQCKENTQESYSIFRMALIFFTAPFLWFRGPMFGLGLSALKQQGYALKYKQRFLLIVAGSFFWLVMMDLKFSIEDKNRKKAIEPELREWEKLWYPKDAATTKRDSSRT